MPTIAKYTGMKNANANALRLSLAPVAPSPDGVDTTIPATNAPKIGTTPR